MLTPLSIFVATSRPAADFLVQNFGNDWLTNMHEIDLPETVSWLALTPFSLGVLLLLSTFCLRLLWRCYGAWCAQLYRRQALQKLQVLNILWRNPAKRVAAAQGLAQLIRQVALTAWPTAHVASRLGDDWLSFLRASGVSSENVPPLLAQLSHLPATRVAQITQAQWQELLDWSEHWVRSHHVSLLDSQAFYKSHELNDSHEGRDAGL